MRWMVFLDMALVALRPNLRPDTAWKRTGFKNRKPARTLFHLGARLRIFARGAGLRVFAFRCQALETVDYALVRHWGTGFTSLAAPCASGQREVVFNPAPDFCARAFAETNKE